MFGAFGAVRADGNALVNPVVEGAKLTLTSLVWPGSGTLLVTATNPNRGYSLTKRIAITITAAGNRAPVWNGPEDQVLGTAANAAAATAANPLRTLRIPLTGASVDAICRDLDGDDITFTVVSVAPAAGVLTATISGSDLVLTRTVSDSSRAAALVTLRATDDGSPAMSSDATFRVDCRTPTSTDESPSVVFNTAHSSLAARALTFPGSADTKDIAGALTPNTGVRIRAYAADRNVVNASVNGTSLTLTPTGAGTTTVTILAERTSGPNTAPGSFALSVTVAQAAGSPAPVWNGPTAGDVALVLGTPKTIDLDDYCSVADGSDPTYSAFSTSATKFTVTTTGARKNSVTLTPVAVTSAVRPQLRLAARSTAGVSTNHRVSVTVSAAPVVPSSTGLTTSSVPSFPGSGTTYYERRSYNIDLTPYFTPGSAGLGVNWGASEVEKVGSQPVSVAIRSFSNGVLRITAGAGSGVVRFRVRAVEAQTGTKTAWQEFSVTITRQPSAPKPRISGIGNRRVQHGNTLDIDPADYTTYSGSATVQYNFTIRTSQGGTAYPLQWVGTTDVIRVSSRHPVGTYRVTVYAWVEPYGRNTLDTDTFTLTVTG